MHKNVKTDGLRIGLTDKEGDRRTDREREDCLLHSKYELMQAIMSCNETGCT